MFPGDFSNHFPYCFRFSEGINFIHIPLPAYLFRFVYCFASFCCRLFIFNAIFGGRFFIEFS